MNANRCQAACLCTGIIIHHRSSIICVTNCVYTCTVKLRYNVLLGTGKIGTLYPRYVVTKHSTVHTFISNASTCIVTMTSRHCTHT